METLPNEISGLIIAKLDRDCLRVCKRWNDIIYSNYSQLDLEEYIKSKDHFSIQYLLNKHSRENTWKPFIKDLFSQLIFANNHEFLEYCCTQLTDKGG